MKDKTIQRVPVVFGVPFRGSLGFVRTDAGRVLTVALFTALAFLWLAGAGRADTITYEQNANGQPQYLPGNTGPNPSFYFPDDNDWNQVVVTATTSGGFVYIAQPSNWSTDNNTYPNSTADDVLIVSDSVTLNVDVTVGSLALSDGATLDQGDYGTTLDVAGPLTLSGSSVISMAAGGAGDDTLIAGGSVTDNGAIDMTTSACTLSFSGVEVSGSGAVVMEASGAVITGTLTQESGHTISGYGGVEAALTNYGLVNANVSGQTLYLDPSNMTNYGIMEASSGGILEITGITVTQGTNAQLLANGGNVQLAGATINGGILNSSNGGAFVVTNSGGDYGATFNSVTNNATVNVVVNGATDVLTITGSLADNGTINVDSTLSFSGVKVSGSGAVVMEAGGAEITGTLTQEAGHTISGYGTMEAALTNNGLVNANVSGQTLYLGGVAKITNNSIMESSSGGVLEIFTTTLTDGSNGQILANGGNVQLIGATINGGVLNASNGGEYMVTDYGSSAGATFNSVTNNATVTVGEFSPLKVNGSLTDNGIIYDTEEPMNFSGIQVSGSGMFVLENSSSAVITGTLTQGAGHTITGQGIIEAALTNHGVVNANVSGQPLDVYGATTNGGVMEASGSATLSFGSGVLTNLSGTTLTGGTYEAIAGGTINLTGSIAVNAATVILSGSRSTFGAINGIAVNKGEFEVLGADTFDTVGALVNSGAVVTSTAGALAVNGALAEDGSGTLAIASGGSFSDTSGYIGSGGAGTASVTVTGSGSTWTNTGNVAVGYSGTGRMVITTGGAVSDGSGFIGYGAGSNGGVTVSGSGAKWTIAAGLIVGDLGAGALTITNGGDVGVTGATTIGSLDVFQFDGKSTFSTGSLAINGGKLVTLGATTFAPSATLGAGGMIVNSEGFSSTFTGNFSGAGGITKSGSGTITLTGASSYTGATAVDAGTLALTTGAAHTASLGNTAITVASGAGFDASAGAAPFSRIVSAGTTVSGTAGATLTLEPGSSFSMAGASLATFNLQQETAFSGPAFTIGGASGIAPSLIFDIGNAATGPDLLRVTKTVSVLASGGDITIDPLAGDSSLTAGSYYLIISAGGFSGVGGNGLALSGTTLAVDGTTYDLSLAHSTADDEILTVTDAPGEPSGPAVDSRRDAVGSTAAVPAGKESAPLVGTTAVPEPGTMMSLLWVFGMAGAWRLPRRRA